MQEKERRIIRPTTALIWKNYFQLLFIFCVMTVSIFLFITFIGLVSNPDKGDGFLEFVSAATLWYYAGWIVFGILFAIFYPIYYRSMTFIVHGDLIEVKKGIINKTEKHVPYRTITNIDMVAGPFDRIFGIGCIKIQTAGGSGSSNTQVAEENIEGLKIYREVRDYIINQLRQFRYKSDTGSSGSEINNQSLTSAQTQVINELVAIRQILNEKSSGE